jgi:hypothetical protein
LSDLASAYPYAKNEKERNIHKALGNENLNNIELAVSALRNGDANALGELFEKAQNLFDRDVAPGCPSELTAPKLHSIMKDVKDNASELIYGGGKGVGSQGDGTVLFVTRGANEQRKLIEYLSSRWKLENSAFELTIPAQKSIRKAIITLAGSAMRMQPSTFFCRKECFPIIDTGIRYYF